MGAACGPCGLGGMCSLLVAVGGGLAALERRSSSAGVHFEVRVLAKLLDTHKNAPQALRLALFGAAVAALLPQRGDGGLDLFSGRATAHRLPQVNPIPRVQTQIPNAVGGQPAAVAPPAEWRGCRGDNSEHSAVGQQEALGGRGAVLDHGLDAAVAAA